MTRVKICGLKIAESVHVATKERADMVGFVFAKSKRQLTLQEAKQLAKDVPPSVLKVGVFVNERLENVLTIAQQVPLDVIQLHGHETDEYIQKIPYPTIKALGIRTEEDVKSLSNYPSATYMLVDAPIAGSGETFNWALLKNVQQPLILAGGLHINNVEEAIRTVNPYMVDVSSGVETNGQKDSEKIKQFIQRAKQGEMTDDRSND